MTVVDLGTEFGLQVDLTGNAEVQVFQGRVEAHSVVQGTEDDPLEMGEAEIARFDTTAGPKDLAGSWKAAFIREIEPRPLSRPALTLIEEGGQIGAGNLALTAGTRTFARDVLAGIPLHKVEHLCDGHYGNDHSWIGSGSGPSFAGVALGQLCRIDSVAFGRDNTGGFNDRWQGTYDIQYTTVSHPDEHTPEHKWRTIATVKYDPDMPQVLSGHLRPQLRHRFGFKPVLATAVRIATSRPDSGIDELEVYGLPERSLREVAK